MTTGAGEPGAGESAARFDALDAARDGRSFELRDLRREITAHRLEEVIPAVRAVEAAVGEGLHAAGYLAYEAAPAFEPAFAAHPSEPGLPLVWFGVFGERREVAPPAAPERAAPPGPLHSALPRDEYEARVRRILEWIAAGDCYQVNLTFPLEGRLEGSEEELYARLCSAQRAAYCAHLRLPGFSVLSASPELFFRLEGDRLELRPMKGTRPRGRWPEEDERLARELAASPKDRAENLMIVDLLRNDAGRIAQFGSVEVPRLFEVERYPTVHQLTSTVTARTRAGTTLEDVLRALFPSGSITGAPKIRTSEIIRSLEDGPRGVYTGAIGFASPGEAVFSVAIRTLLLRRGGGLLRLGVGSGITADSDPAAEHAECLQKAAFVHAAAGEFRLLSSLRHAASTGYWLLEGHLARLSASAAYFGFRFDRHAARFALAGAAAGFPEGIRKVRLLVGRDGSLEVQSEEIAEASGPPLRLALAPEPVDERDPFLFHKTTRRELYRDRAASRPDADDVVLMNRRGELTETTTSNLVLKLGGELLTPPLSAGLLPGVLRAQLLAAGEVAERTLVPADLANAEAVYLVNSVRGWREATLVD